MDEDIAVVRSGAELSALPLDTVALKGDDLGDEDLIGIERLEALTTLYLDGCFSLGDESLARAARLPALRTLYISGRSITDEGLAHLVGAAGLEELGLDAPVTGEGFRSLGGLGSLSELHLPGLPNLTAAGLAAIAALPGLAKLRLYSVAGLDDARLGELSRATSLRELTLMNCQGVTVEGIQTLAHALPDCRIQHV